MSRRINKPEFWDNIAERSEDPVKCWVWAGAILPNGYGLWSGKEGNNAHRAAWVLTNGPIPDGMFVCHSCDNRRCVRPAHLYLGTARDNAIDKINKGRQQNVSGTKNGQAKLTEAAVIIIRQSTDSCESLAKRFGVAKSRIASARRGESWKHVKVIAVVPPKKRGKKK